MRVPPRRTAPHPQRGRRRAQGDRSRGGGSDPRPGPHPERRPGGRLRRPGPRGDGPGGRRGLEGRAQGRRRARPVLRGFDPQADRAESRGEAGFETPPRRSHLDGLESVYEQRPKADCGVLCERRGARPATAPVLKQRCGGSTAPRVRPLPVPGPFRCQAPSGARRAQGDLPSILLDPPKEWIVGLRIPHL